jgi:hypothetical protein
MTIMPDPRDRLAQMADDDTARDDRDRVDEDRPVVADESELDHDVEARVDDGKIEAVDEDVSDTAPDTNDTDSPRTATRRDEVPAATPGLLPQADLPDGGALLTGPAAEELRQRWHEIQHEFVDDPRHAVDDAAQLVSLAADRFTSMLRDRVDSLGERGPDKDKTDGEADTEELRVLMRNYHELLDRMLAA